MKVFCIGALALALPSLSALGQTPQTPETPAAASASSSTSTPATPAARQSWRQTSIALGLSTYSGSQDSVQASGQVNSNVQNGRLEVDGMANLGVMKSAGQALMHQEEVDWAFRLSGKRRGRTFVMAHTWYEHDDLSGVDLRAAIGPGFGLHLVDTQKMRWTLEGGVAVTTEKQVVDDTFATLFLDPSLKWTITDKVTLLHKVNFRFNAEEQSDVRIHSESDVNVNISQRLGLGFSVTVDFDNHPVPGHDKTDIQSATHLSFTFGRGNPPAGP